MKSKRFTWKRLTKIDTLIFLSVKIEINIDNHSRVKCSSSDNFYCNASHMKSVLDGKDFAIFAQAPTP